MNNVKYIYLILFLFFFSTTKNSYSALPIEECKSFQEEQLFLMCLEFSIAERINNELPYNLSTIHNNYDRDYLDSLFFSRSALSPQDPVNDIFVGSIDGNTFHIRAAFYDINLSDDDPNFIFFELKIFIENGRAFVRLERRTKY